MRAVRGEGPPRRCGRRQGGLRGRRRVCPRS